MAQEEENIELTDAIKEELDRRLERHRDGTAKYYSWEEVKKMLAEKRNKK
ncbi:addiction module protein [Maribacter sp. IgM3_T14_3]